MHENSADIVRRSERRLQAIIDAEPACVKLVSPQGTLIDMNRAGLHMIGAADLSEVEGQPMVDLIHPADREIYLRLMDNASVGTPGTAEYRIISLTGRELWMESHAVPFDADLSGGTPSAVLAVTSDVTQRKNLEEQLWQAQRLEAVGRLAGGVAHDFNNLLTAILGNCDLMAMQLPPGDESQDNLSEIRDAGQRGAALVQQLLAFSRKQVLKPRVLDLNQAVANLVKLLPRMLGEDITPSVTLDPDLMHVRVDATQIDQVLLNLALNARDAMPGGGAIVITTRNATLTRAPISQPCRFDPGEYVKLTFADTGAGMNPETQARAFEPFFTTKDHGTGLGLATAYGIIKQSRGFITVDSEPGRGSVFTILLPGTTAPIDQQEQIPEISTTSGTETVLLVEDAGAVRSLAERTLKAAGHAVLTASNATEALDIASRQPFDLLVTDIVMPGMNGVDLATMLSRLIPGLRVLFMSGYDAESRAERAVASQPAQLLQKPFTPAALSHAVRQALDAEPTGRPA